MRRHWLWITLLCLVGLVATYYALGAALHIQRYLALNRQVPAMDTEWSIEKLRSDRYALCVAYRFRVNDTVYSGEQLLEERLFRNKRTAELALAGAENQLWRVWYQASDPSLSRVEKRFPAKVLVYALVSIGLVVYLVLLGLFSRRGSTSY